MSAVLNTNPSNFQQHSRQALHYIVSLGLDFNQQTQIGWRSLNKRPGFQTKNQNPNPIQLTIITKHNSIDSLQSIDIVNQIHILKLHCCTDHLHEHVKLIIEWTTSYCILLITGKRHTDSTFGVPISTRSTSCCWSLFDPPAGPSWPSKPLLAQGTLNWCVLRCRLVDWWMFIGQGIVWKAQLRRWARWSGLEWVQQDELGEIIRSTVLEFHLNHFPTQNS